MKKYTWEFDKSATIWRNECHVTIEECIKEAERENQECFRKYPVVYIGEANPFVPYVDGISVLDEIGENMYDCVGEVAEYADLYDFKKKEELEELDEELTKVLHKWLKKYNYYPGCYKIKNIKEYKLI